MKARITILAGLFLSGVAIADDALITLAKTKAVVSDEMFHFAVSYTNVHYEANALHFTMSLQHDDVLDSYYRITTKVALPLDILKTAERTVINRNEVSHSHCVRIMLPVIPSRELVDSTAETRDTEGNTTTEVRESQDAILNVYFASSADALEWNGQLDDFLRNHER